MSLFYFSKLSLRNVTLLYMIEFDAKYTKYIYWKMFHNIQNWNSIFENYNKNFDQEFIYSYANFTQFSSSRSVCRCCWYNLQRKCPSRYRWVWTKIQRPATRTSKLSKSGSLNNHTYLNSMVQTYVLISYERRNTVAQNALNLELFLQLYRLYPRQYAYFLHDCKLNNSNDNNWSLCFDTRY